MGERPDASVRLAVDGEGVMSLGELSMMLDYRDGKSTPQDGKHVVVADSGYPQGTPGREWLLEGRYRPKTSPDPLPLTEAVERVSPNSVRLQAGVREVASPTATLRWVLRLPDTAYAGQELLVDGKSVLLPEKVDTFSVDAFKPGQVEVPLDAGMLTVGAGGSLLIGDGRYYKQGHFSLIYDQGTGASPDVRGFEGTLAYRPYHYTPISLAAAANMGFTDEVGGDQRGGWTDEGNGHDLHEFPVGEQAFDGVPFAIVDPAANDGVSCLVFAGHPRNYFLKEASVTVDGSPLRRLFLLHAFAWDKDEGTLLGTMTVRFADGSSMDIPVRAHVDATNWTAPYDAPNGTIVWKGSSGRRSEVGLNLSRFTLPGKPVVGIDFTGSGEAVWMVAGLTGSADPVLAPASSRRKPLVMAANDEWQPFLQEPNVQAGSILDFSSLVDAPAGKYGPVLIRDGHFVFEQQPDRPVRFWGTNLCWGSSYVDKVLAERVAVRLARMGYNTVRLHHYDGLMLRDNPESSWDIDPDQLDRFDYLIYCLRKEGLYINLDLYTMRTFPAGEVEEVDGDVRRGIKAGVALSPSAREAWGKFARVLMTHKNPYTGLTYAEDPALIGVCPINENVYEVFWSSDAAVAQLFNQRFQQWLDSEGMADASEEEKSLAFALFLTRLQGMTQKKLESFLKDEVGVHAPLTDVNHKAYKQLTFVRDQLDYVDMHGYWDHPRFAGAAWNLPYLHDSTSVLTQLAEIPRKMFPARIPGKPFAVTEFNYSFPNPYRGESGPIMGAYASLQDWDAVYRFNYNGGRVSHLDELSPINGLSTVSDPMLVLADRIIALLFLRADAAPADETIVYEVDYDTTFATPEGIGEFSDEFSTLGLVTAVGSMVAGSQTATDEDIIAGVVQPGAKPSLPVESFTDGPELLQQVADSGLFDSELIDLKQRRFTSVTREIVLDAGAGHFEVVTPRTEAFAVSVPGAVHGDFARVQVDEAAVFAVSAMDGKPLADSARLLLVHLTDAQNTGSRFRTAERRIIESWGEAPVLVKRGAAQVKLKTAPGAKVRLWAVEISGKRLWEVPVTATPEGISFALNTLNPQGVALAYELEINR
ncbi:MAG: hypothetical protein Q7Q73_16240 [Verrucomicrobiota bacterium JB024]|nr:hypothetical protein [Verrucomicrobiota bacterium JB024]